MILKKLYSYVFYYTKTNIQLYTHEFRSRPIIFYRNVLCYRHYIVSRRNNFAQNLKKILLTIYI